MKNKTSSSHIFHGYIIPYYRLFCLINFYKLKKFLCISPYFIQIVIIYFFYNIYAGLFKITMLFFYYIIAINYNK